MKKAFTLIEALIVMSITVIVLSFGTVGIFSLRDSLELQNGYSNLISYIRSVQNMARNSTKLFGYTPVYYGVVFESDGVFLSACNRNGDDVLCLAESDSKTKKEVLKNLELKFKTNCQSLKVFSFKRSDVDLVGMRLRSTADQNFNELVSVTNTGECTISIVHKNSGNSKEFTLNLTNNSIDLKESKK